MCNEMGMLRYVALNYHVHSFRLFYDVHAQEKSRPCLVTSMRPGCVRTIQPHPYDQGASMRTDHIM